MKDENIVPSGIGTLSEKSLHAGLKEWVSEPGDAFEVGPSQQWQLVFSFSAGLLPGVYFVGGGVIPVEQPGRYIHRVIDYAAFRVLSSPECTQMGVCDLSATPPELIRPSAPPETAPPQREPRQYQPREEEPEAPLPEAPKVAVKKDFNFK